MVKCFFNSLLSPEIDWCLLQKGWMQRQELIPCKNGWYRNVNLPSLQSNENTHFENVWEYHPGLTVDEQCTFCLCNWSRLPLDAQRRKLGVARRGQAGGLMGLYHPPRLSDRRAFATVTWACLDSGRSHLVQQKWESLTHHWHHLPSALGLQWFERLTSNPLLFPGRCWKFCACNIPWSLRSRRVVTGQGTSSLC